MSHSLRARGGEVTRVIGCGAALVGLAALLGALVACRPSTTATDDAPAFELPRSSSDVAMGTGTEVELAREGLRVGGVPVRDGSAPRGDGHRTAAVLPELRDALAPHAAAHRPSAPRDELRDRPRLAMHVRADRRVPFGALADVLRTATAAGYFDLSLAVAGREGDAAIAIAAPSSWLPPLPDDVKVCRESAVFVELDTAGARALSTEGEVTEIAGVEGCVGCVDREALAAFAANTKSDMPHETVVTLRVDPRVPVEQVVAALDTLRGASCRLRGAVAGREEVPESCLLWQPILDTLPPTNPG